MRSRPMLLSVLCALVLVACEQPTEPPQHHDSPEPIMVDPWLTSLQHLTKALSSAAQEERVRVELRNALRDSPYNEHKVLLQDFLASGAGQLTYEAMAAVVRGGEEGLKQLLLAVPAMDLYLPIRAHRTEWRPTMPLMVASTPNPDLDHLTVIQREGSKAVTPVAVAKQVQGLLVLHPAEAKHIRVSGNSRYRGSAVEAPGELSIAGAMITRDANGNIVATEEFADVGYVLAADDCDPMTAVEPCDDTGGGSLCSGVVLDDVYVRFGDGVGSAEVEWTLWDDSHSSVTLRVTDLEKNLWKNVHLCFWDGVVSYKEGDWLDAGNLHAIETDAFSDDDWGYGNVSTYDSGDIIETRAICDLIGDPNTQYDSNCEFNGTTITTRVIINW